MKVSFAEYIDRPSIVKGSATNSQIRLVKQDYQQRFDALYIRESAMIVHKTYKDKQSSAFYLYIKMPSESIPGHYHDVVLEFKPTPAVKVLDVPLDRYHVRFFSNDPAFLFTYAYAFNKAELVIDWLKPKLSKEALTVRPVVRNPKAETGYVKSLYFAYFFMKIRHLFDLNNTAWQSAADLNKRMLLHEIPRFDDKMARGKRLQEFQKEKIKQQRLEERQRRAMPYQSDHIKAVDSVTKSRGINRSRGTKVVNAIKNSKVVKRK